ncbi:MAG: hypothetical protein KDB79_10680 [Acidobacteria bacterium]|nr:hypothetical protein [Acidobacteriota bacterium]
MATVLIVSYFFPPGNFVASNRPHSFALNLKKFGLDPVVVTRHWDEADFNWSDMDRINESPPSVIEDDNFKLIRLPYFSRWYGLCKPFHGIPVIRKLIHIFYMFFGVFYPHESAYECFYKYISEYVSNEPVDYIMVISSPLNIVKLGERISKENGIPLIVDFRDLWDNELLARAKTPSAENRLKNYIYEFYLRRWLRSASLITSVSQPLVDEIERIIPGKKTAVVMNGFEETRLKQFEDQAGVKTAKFTFSVVGTLYPHQDLSIMIDGLRKFVAGKDPSKIQLNFIGAAVFPEVKKMLEDNLPQESTLITERIPREEAIIEMGQSNVLFYPAWKGYRGVVSAKFYEYLCVGRRILIAPGDRDIIEDIIDKTNAGEIADSADQFVSILQAWFDEWKETGTLKSETRIDLIRSYSRENQCELLAQKILEIS